jgi:16S rRNA processing protein RimM
LPELVAVGRVGRPHGLHGAFVVEGASDDPRRFEVGAHLYVDGEAAAIVESKRAGGRPVIKLDRAVARGAVLEVDRGALPEPEPEHYYVADLVGLAVEREDGRPLGRVRAVEDRVANAVLELDTGLLLPLVDACIREVDLGARRIVVAPGFDEAD